MEKETLESLIIDYIDNKLNTADRQFVEQELTRNPEAYKLYEELREVLQVMDKASNMEPSSKLSRSFEKMLQQQIDETGPSKTVLFWPTFYKVAAAVALLIVATGFGFWLSNHLEQQREIAKLKLEMEQTRKAMMAMLENPLSASQRIQGVNVAMQMKKADPEIVQVLYKTMIDDANTNVRLSALEALNKFNFDPSVRKLLVTSLSIQSDPVVQIALIQILVQLNEKGVVNDLQKIIDDSGTMKAVKDEAYTGILKLS
jgi:hypothetical protein